MDGFGGPYCGHTWDPEWYEPSRGVHTCVRPVWDDAADDRCWWHTTSEKSFTALQGPEFDETAAPLWRVPADRRAVNGASPARGPADPGDDRGYWPDCVSEPFPPAPDRADDDLFEGYPEPAELLCGARLDGIAFRDALDFTGVWFNDATLAGANVRGAAMAETDLERVDLSDAVLRETDLRSADVRADLTDAYMQGVRLAGGRLGTSNEMYAALPQASLAGAVVADGDLRCANLENADCSDAVFTGADLRRAKLEGATLERATLFGADLRDAAVYGATFADALADDATRLLSVAEANGPLGRLRASLPDALGGGVDRTTAYDPGETGSSVARWEAAAPDGGRGAAPTRWRRAMWTYRAIESVAETNALTALGRAAFLRRKDLRRRHETTGASALGAAASSAVIRYGEGYGRVLAWAVALVALFAGIYPIGGWIRPVEAGGALGEPITWAAIRADPATLWESIYYSTLTFTNLGFGDYQPVGAVGQALTIAETGIGVVLLALLVFVVGRRAAR